MRFSDVVNALVRLVVGVLSGFYFERRATKAARADADNLRRQLGELREGVYGRVEAPRPKPVDDALPERVHAWILRFLGPDGRVSKGKLVGHFASQGHSNAELERAIQALTDQNRVRTIDNWLEVVR